MDWYGRRELTLKAPKTAVRRTCENIYEIFVLLKKTERAVVEGRSAVLPGFGVVNRGRILHCNEQSEPGGPRTPHTKDSFYETRDFESAPRDSKER